MRDIISDSSGPRLVPSSTGALKLIRTGTDHFHEHNSGPYRLAPIICALGSPVSASLLERYLVTKTDFVEFHRLPSETAEEEEAIIGVNLTGGHHFLSSKRPALTDPWTLRKLTHFKDDVAAALLYGNFAIRVRGAAKVAALAEFHQQMVAGNVALIPDKWDCVGIAFVNVKELSAEERESFEADPQKTIVGWFRVPALNQKR